MGDYDKSETHISNHVIENWRQGIQTVRATEKFHLSQNTTTNNKYILYTIIPNKDIEQYLTKHILNV